ncbi:hypothetical protein SERLA73DRAFT_150416 [Serpula lacrymans var. lacrymans S7.3]|uniref:NmrA-like domain-containing protein n=2 Tax=Serpula lacrymans var. lacrymans TaxID=341189 RepID=F8PMF8_SERL3|nr:uncharacterized protein SERLADRAFT_413373 [Serpula lacrymans var. lacrymans S7.9]EGO02790.1 hypothetical protein SERLA73DRAFT_150416 [Serpula lacrymans var. lacrymans S7.3]EGO28489.1 hypothetical protein SERLADRAFT_413373 [Serpula lacrymans var. lacrymans S7.9]
MSTANYHSFAVVGAGPTIGIPIVRALLARKAAVVVLTRTGSSRELPEGAHVVPVDYSDVQVVTLVLQKYNVDVVVSAVPFDGISAQRPLADAAKAAGVKLFMPSEYGMPTEGSDGILGLKSHFALYLRSIELPSARVYTGVFYEYIPWLAAVRETGKFLIAGKGRTPFSFTAREDAAGFVAHILTTLPPSKLHDATFRIQGHRGTLSDIAKLYAHIAPVKYVDFIPHEVSAARVREYLQKKVDLGAASTGWDPLTGREGKQPAGSSNSLWEGHQWKKVKDVLHLNP